MRRKKPELCYSSDKNNFNLILHARRNVQAKTITSIALVKISSVLSTFR